MSLKNQKNLIVAGGVIVALLAGTVLLGGYAKFVPAKADSTTGAEPCTGCPATQACLAKNAEVSGSGQVMAAFNPESCPAGRTEPCCAEDPPKDCCGEPCPADCPKPCCAKQPEASGCCPAADAATQ